MISNQKILDAISYLKDVTDSNASSILSHLRELRSLVLTLKREPEPKTAFFAMMLVEANGVLVGGSSKRIWSQSREVLEVIPQYRLDKFRVIVFADMSYVQVPSIFCGVNVLNMFGGNCPMAWGDRCEVGQKIYCEIFAQ